MSPKVRLWIATGVGLAVSAVVIAALVLSRPKPPPPAPPPPPPPQWRCGTAYGKEICERALPPLPARAEAPKR